MLSVLKPFFYTSLQDRGRFLYRHFGVPVSGAMDQGALCRANALLENEPGSAVLEITMQGPELEFAEPTFMVLSGAPLEASLNGKPLQMNQVHQVPAGAILSCGHVLEGLRTYLSVRGGFLSEPMLGSRSQFYPVTKARALARGVEVPYQACSEFSPKLLQISSRGLFGQKELQVYPGPEFGLLSALQKEQVFGSEFQVAKEHDRMACQLQPAIEGHSYSMITSATLPGTVQLTPSGRLMVLMRDGQTTGGYPRILQLDDESMNIMSQKRFGDTVTFKSI